MPVTVTASENVTRILTLWPARYDPFAVLEVTFVIVGAVVSTTRALLFARELAVPLPVATVNVALFPATSVIVPPFSERALDDWQSRSAEVSPLEIV